MPEKSAVCSNIHAPRVLITASQLSEKYPVEVWRPTAHWWERLRIWRETQILVEGRHWMMKHIRRGRPSFGYDERCVLFLVRRDAPGDWFLEMVLEQHRDAIMSVLQPK